MEMDVASTHAASSSRVRLLLKKVAARFKRPSSPAEAARARARRQTAILAKAAAALPYLQLALAVAGFLQFLAIPLPISQLLKKSYIDENAFQPGQVNTYFSWSDVSAADRHAEGLQAFVNINESIARSDYIVQQLQEQGLPGFVQDYQTHVPEVSSTRRNVYTRLQSPKTSGAEVIVLCAPWNSREAGMKNVRGTATLLALAKHLQRLSMWSKDIILLFSDGDTDGTQAWLRAYHGVIEHDDGPLPVGGGSIWSAITLDYPHHSFSHIGLYYDGVNGRLPNLDVVHGAAHIIKWVGGVPVRLHNQTIIDIPAEYDTSSFVTHYAQRAKGVLQQTIHSASTLPSGAEGLFAQYGIDSIAFFAVPAEGPHGFYDVGRIMESMARAFNNLTERLHASFLLYLLPEPFQFLSVATYLSAPILIGAALTIAGLRLWRHCPSRAKMSVWQPISFAYAVGSSLLYFDQHGLDSLFINAIMAVALVGLVSTNSASAAAALPLGCLICGMLISVTSILNYGLGTGMALMSGMPCLAAVYGPVGRQDGLMRRGVISLSLALCVFATMHQYSELRPNFLGISGLAPVILYLGLVPVWLQMAIVA